MLNSIRKTDLALAAALMGATAGVFWPVFLWIAGETLAHEQLRQSLALMFFAAVYVAFDRWHSLRPAFEISNVNLAFLAFSFLLAVGSIAVPNPYTVLVALALALFSLGRIVFGARALPVLLPFVVTFGAFVAFIVLFPVLDWPLRALAGTYAGDLLARAGFATTLTVHGAPEPLLLMSVDGRLFEVAAECNGFGLMSTATLLALLLTVSRRMPLWWKIAGVLLAVAVGFVFNILRIIGIVLAAPYFPDHYDIMHETVGLAALFAGLATVWFLVGGGSREDGVRNHFSAED